MKKIVFVIFVLLNLVALAQERRILCFNLEDNTIDTLEIPDFDTTIVEDKTNYFIGNYSNEFNILEQIAPEENLFEGSQFTRKRQASLDFDITQFPVRTTVKIFKLENDSLKNNCTGNLISRRHVLTACHCVAPIGEDSIMYDSLFVCPVYDNGDFSLYFETSMVSKIYIFENWSIINTDFAVLELENPIGATNGWISLGFDLDDENFADGIFYKFSYPNVTMLNLDPNYYNGDTLYYNYGVVDIVNDDSFGVSGTIAIPGESGSSLIKVVNGNLYTSYGVLVFASAMQHSKLTNWKYYSIKSIIEDDLEFVGDENIKNDGISVFPNPFINVTKISCSDCKAINKLSVFDVKGQKLFEKTFGSTQITQDWSFLPVGMYFLILDVDNRMVVKKLIKN